MTDPLIHQMSRAIGSLEASVKALNENWQQKDREASEGRRALYCKVNELKSEQGTLTLQVAQLAIELAEVKPAIRRFEAQRQREEGARSAIKVIWIAACAFAAGIGYAGHEMLVYLWPPKH